MLIDLSSSVVPVSLVGLYRPLIDPFHFVQTADGQTRQIVDGQSGML